MARSRIGGGGTGWMVATILFVILFFFSAVLAIIFYTREASAKQKENAAVQALDKWVLPRERTQSQELQAMLGQTNDQQSVVTMLNADLRWALGRIAPGEGSRDAIQNALKALGVSPERALMDEIRQLKAVADNAEEERQAAVKQAEEAREQLQQAAAQRDALAEQYKQAVSGIKSEFDTEKGGYQAFVDRTQQQIKELEQTLAQVRQQTRDQVLEMESQGLQKDARIRQLQAALDDINIKKGPQGQDNPVTAPDGHVVATLTDEDLVYIDLTRQDGVQPGMSFEVFGKNTLIRLNRYDELRGKASLEVINVSDTSALARVVRRDRNAIVLEGDQVANIAYDPNTTLRFYVHGLYDIDNLGRATDSDRERIKALIRRYGGDVANEMNYQVDYLVLGEEPDVPEKPADNADIETIQTYIAAKNAYEEYQNLIAQAKDFRIPVLNQNRFLALVGYHSR